MQTGVASPREWCGTPLRVSAAVWEREPRRVNTARRVVGNGGTVQGERLTLMCAMMDHRTEYAGPEEKGDQWWLLADNIREHLPPRTREYYDNWRSIAEPRMLEAKKLEARL